MDSVGARIIRFLKDGGHGYLSGETLSRRLGISRTAVWKHVESLRKLGYSIKAYPKKGYMLKPHALPFNSIEIASRVSTDAIGRRLFFYPTIDSTNSKAFELAKKGFTEGTAVVADTQLSGKGRLGRKWFSPSGVNLYTSIILRPMIPPVKAQPLQLLAAVATAETIEDYLRRKPEVKWPNDILIDSKKVAGILMEMSSEMDKINFIVVGIGVNVNMEPLKAPSDIKAVATSLREKTGMVIDRVEFIDRLYLNLEKWYKRFNKQGPLGVLEAWKGYFLKEGKPIRIKGARVTEGVCMGVDEEGALLVRNIYGNIERIVAGDVE